MRAASEFQHGASVIVPIAVAAWLNDQFRLDLLRPQIRGLDAEVDSVLMAISQAAQIYRLTDVGTLSAPLSEQPSRLISTARAAGLIGISDRAVRAAISRKVLPARRVDGRWQIARIDAENYRNRKAA